MISFSKGDFLRLFTGIGVTETENQEGEFFGEERVLDEMKKLGKNSTHDFNLELLEKYKISKVIRPLQMM